MGHGLHLEILFIDLQELNVIVVEGLHCSNSNRCVLFGAGRCFNDTLPEPRANLRCLL